MKGMPFNLQAQSLLDSSSTTNYWNFVSNNNNKKRKKKEEEGIEPCSVLDNTRSPSPPTSSSSLGGGVATLSDNNTSNNVVTAVVGAEKKEEWVSELQLIPSPPPPSLGGGGGNLLEDWESMLHETTHEQTFLKWIMGDDLTDPKYDQPPQFDGFGAGLGEFQTPAPLLNTNNQILLPPVVPNSSLPVIFQEPAVDMGFVIPPSPKSQHLITNPYEVLPKNPFLPQQAMVDQLFKAAELIEAGNPFSAREILARLNQQLPPSLGLKPIVRAAFLFKEVLMALACNPSSIPTPILNPWDVVLKLSSYKAFSEVSPLVHFTNFTCTQTLLEEIGGDARIHIVDFDIGVGGQWSSFMQELAHHRSLAIPFLKITALVNPSSFHPLELHLTRDNLSHFAAELNIPFEFNFLSAESFDPNEFLAVSANESIAINLPIGSHYVQSFPTLLRLVKQLNPKIVVSVDQGCDRSDLPFSHHFLHSFQACMILLDSIDASGTNTDVVNKIETFVVRPKIESLILGRHRIVEKMPPWRVLFTSVGFIPFQFSNFTETQAECLLKRVQVRGFHVEKRQASLFLYWQRGELGSVSAWKC